MATKTVSPARQVKEFIGKFDPAVAKLARSARSAMRKRFPTAVELVYDNYNALAMGFGSTERTSDVIISVAVYASGVNLYFVYGRSLPDPKKLLQGAGTQGAFIRFTGMSVLDDPAVDALLTAAEKRQRPPLAPSGRGYTIIKSISAKQRPRRLQKNKSRSSR
ncbi:MAG TPA: hypothetical protein VF251_08285 [Pyrinomonadaceae bacterium]